ncbi:MAG TPA: hypothetical protein PLP17_04355 [Oligoflexia bacterium]|nr:hypothetical protein [Oligoflexia bacterium]
MAWPQRDPLGAYKLAGYVFLDVLFLLLGLFGLAMSYRGMPLSDVFFAVFCLPAANFVAHLTDAPWCYLLCAVWFLVVAFFIFPTWRKLKYRSADVRLKKPCAAASYLPPHRDEQNLYVFGTCFLRPHAVV